jgi:hypothetical protein
MVALDKKLDARVRISRQKCKRSAAYCAGKRIESRPMYPGPESPRAAQLPERPSSLQQFHIKGAICEPLHRGPISRPYPHREPVLIGVPLELLAEPDLMDKPSLQTLQALGWRATHCNVFGPPMPAVRVFQPEPDVSSGRRLWPDHPSS